MKRQQARKKTVIGLTGGFGTGKTLVARYFRAAGAQVIDADRLAHARIRPGRPQWRALIAEFGADILKEDKTIDRAELGRRVFDKSSRVKKINAIVHPGVIRDVRALIRGSHRSLIVIDAPLLIETGLRESVDAVVVVKLEASKQIQRLCAKRHLSRLEIKRRIRAQMPLSKKIRMADFIIDNNGTTAKTKKQVRVIVNQLRR